VHANKERMDMIRTKLSLCGLAVLGTLLLASCASQTVGEGSYLAGDYPAAEAKIQAYLAEHPDSVSARRRLAIVYFDGGKYPQAAEQFAAFVPKTRNMYEEQLYYGLSLLGAGRTAEGMEVLQGFSYPEHFRIQEFVRAEVGRIDPAKDPHLSLIQLRNAWQRGVVFEEQERRGDHDSPF
jgi:tetratricopeptide (TPR) repeat protein